MEPRRGYRPWCGLRHHLPRMVLPLSQRMGHSRYHPLSLRHALELCRFHRLPRALCAIRVERATAEMGSCRYLLAYRRILFADHPHRPAPTGLMGMGTVHLCMAMRHCGNDHLFPSSRRTQQYRDPGLYRHGTQCACCFQAVDRLCVSGCRHMDHCRRCGLHHGSPVLYIA